MNANAYLEVDCEIKGRNQSLDIAALDVTISLAKIYRDIGEA